MPLTLSQLAANRARVSLEYAGQDITLEYAPALITESALADMFTLESGAKALMEGVDAAQGMSDFAVFMATLNTLLCRVAVWWDVYEDDAQTVMFPLTPERIAALPIDFRLACFFAIFKDVRLGELTGTPPNGRSGASSSAGAKRTSRR